MPLLSQKDGREFMQSIIPAEPIVKADFSEVFAAGVGQVFDEEASISSHLNMEGWQQRKQQVKDLGDKGVFNINNYTSPTGVFNYEKLSNDRPELEIKTDRTLYDERVEMLRKRREYSQDVFERGSGMAQFLGMATGFMLDPVNVATMPVATMGTAVKGLSTLGRSLMVARNEAGLAIAAELMIQPLVYEHKHDIESPFEFTDAITNIATAATGAAAIGGITGGIAGYFKRVREKAITQPLDGDAAASLRAISRIEDDLNNNPKKANIDLKKVEDDFIQKVRAEIKAKADQESLTDSLDALDTKFGRAKVDHETMSNDELLDVFQEKIDGLKFQREMEIDIEYLTESNKAMESYNKSFKQAEEYEIPKRAPTTKGTITQRERAVLEQQGTQVDYDVDMEAYKALKNPHIMQGEDVVNAEEFMQSIDDEISGMDDVLRCALG